MGVFRQIAEKFADSLATSGMEKMASNAGTSIARSMLLSATTMKNFYGDAAPTYAWLARKALSARPRWQQVDEIRFRFENNQVIEIPDSYSLLQTIHAIIEVEVSDALIDNQPQWRVVELLRLAHKAGEDFIMNR